MPNVRKLLEMMKSGNSSVKGMMMGLRTPFFLNFRWLDSWLIYWQPITIKYLSNLFELIFPNGFIYPKAGTDIFIDSFDTFGGFHDPEAFIHPSCDRTSLTDPVSTISAKNILTNSLKRSFTSS